MIRSSITGFISDATLLGLLSRMSRCECRVTYISHLSCELVVTGATLVPQQGYWHSAPDSDHMVSCPNSNACQGNTAFLLACQNATYSAGITLNQVTPHFQNLS